MSARHWITPLRATAVAAVVAAGCGGKAAPPPPAREVRASFASAELPRTDPDAPAWSSAVEAEAALMPQDIIDPKLLRPGVSSVRIQALHDGNWLVLRLQWQDPTRDVLLGTNLFSDAVAVQFPAAPGSEVPDAAMGAAGRRVDIIYWKAAWQETLDPIAALRPNATTDHYPFQAAGAEARGPLELAYAPARAAGNPIAMRAPGAPVQDLIAEGYGSLAPAPEQRSTGRGVWRDGRWRVTLARPLGPAQSSPLVPGRRTYVAVALWDGAAGQVGAKKMRSAWIPLWLAELKP